jgi:AcrR family transcriptional regulator
MAEVVRDGAGAPRRGRPRDPSIDARVLAATTELLAERGYSATTVQEVARRAGVPASAIYRRWPSRLDLIEDAVYPGLGEIDLTASGDLRADLRRLVDGLQGLLTRPASRAALPGLVAEYQADGNWRSADRWVPVSARPYLRQILDVAGPSAVDPSIEPDAVFDLMLGAILVDSFVPTPTSTRHRADVVVDLLCRAVRPG